MATLTEYVRTISYNLIINVPILSEKRLSPLVEPHTRQ